MTKEYNIPAAYMLRAFESKWNPEALVSLLLL